MRILLNTTRKDNYMFIDKESNAFLNLEKPVCVINKLSQAVLRGIKYDTLIDIDEVTGIEVTPAHKAVHDKLIKKCGLIRVNKNVAEAAKEDALKEGKAAIEQLVDAGTKEVASDAIKETKSKKTSKSKKDSEE